MLDNIVALNEVIEDIKGRKEDCFLYKIDFAKAYDSIEWSCLKVLNC